MQHLKDKSTRQSLSQCLSVSVVKSRLHSNFLFQHRDTESQSQERPNFGLVYDVKIDKLSLMNNPCIFFHQIGR